MIVCVPHTQASVCKCFHSHRLKQHGEGHVNLPSKSPRAFISSRECEYLPKEVLFIQLACREPHGDSVFGVLHLFCLYCDLASGGTCMHVTRKTLILQLL